MKLQPVFRFLLFFSVVALIIFYVYQKKSVEEKEQIVIYAHSSFIGKYGPGPILAKEFKKQTGLAVKYVNVGEAGLLLTKINSNSGAVDLVIGLDNFSLQRAAKNLKWKPLDGVENNFLMYDWAPLSFIYKDKKYQNISKFTDFKKHPNLKLTIPDPRFSTTGLAFLYWVYSLSGEKEFKKSLIDLKPNIHSFPSSWSASYGIFKQGKEAQMSLSYVTSPVYHWIEERDKSYQVLSFSKHIVHKEYLGIPARCVSCKAALKFVELMMSNFGQTTLMTKNYMLPIDSRLLLGTEFINLPQLNISDDKLENEFNLKKEELINVWKDVFK